jgi:hypothetical protein
MSTKKPRLKKQGRMADPSGPNRSAQLLFVIFAVLLILSMVLSAVANY